MGSKMYYYIKFGTHGNRSNNINKYIDDALLLKNAYEIEQDEVLKNRYLFYCAQSYKDCCNFNFNIEYYHKSIELYKKVLDSKNWSQEKYHSCIMIGNMSYVIDKIEDALYYWSKSYEYDNERIDGIVKLCEYFHNKKNHIIVNMIYNKYKNYDKLDKIHSKKLFINIDLYNDMLEYYNSISSYYINHKDEGYQCIKKIILNKKIKQRYYDITINNLHFYLDYLKKDEQKNIICDIILEYYNSHPQQNLFKNINNILCHHY